MVFRFVSGSKFTLSRRCLTRRAQGEMKWSFFWPVCKASSFQFFLSDPQYTPYPHIYATQSREPRQLERDTRRAVSPHPLFGLSAYVVHTAPVDADPPPDRSGHNGRRNLYVIRSSLQFHLRKPSASHLQIHPGTFPILAIRYTRSNSDSPS